MSQTSNSPNPLNRRNLSRATFAAVILAVGGIALFIALWIALAGLDQFARLMLSLCIPPALIAAIVGGYLLLVQPKRNV